MAFKICTINLGSTSTKVALFKGGEKLFSANVAHDASELARFKEIGDQLEYRRNTILAELERAGQTLADCDAFSSRGGGLVSCPSGTYEINDLLFEHARVGFSVKHPAGLGPQIARSFAERYGGRAFVVNPPDVDELCDSARVTGWKGVYRESRLHALNQKEVAGRYAASCGRRYEELNLVVCHLGGGISITAHERGRMVDSNNTAQGDGPMTPTRSGSLPVVDVVEACFSGRYTQRELYDRITKVGGLVDHLGTSDVREVVARIKAGDAYAKIVYDALIYQVGKDVGAMACVLGGAVDAIILTGGIAHDHYLVERLTQMVSFLAPVHVMAGEFEMEALAAGALRVLSGKEQAREYTGVPLWNGFAEA